jgi:hypothetical protein
VGLCDYWDVRVRSPDGEWIIDVIHLTLTGTHRDGEWLRVRRWGMHFADLRTVEQLAEVVDLATLEEALVRDAVSSSGVVHQAALGRLAGGLAGC